MGGVVGVTTTLLQQFLGIFAGFDVPVLPGVFFHGMLFPSCVNREVETQAKIAVNAYNRRMRRDLQLVRVLRAVTGVSSFTPYYITLEAKDGKGEVRTYKTHAAFELMLVVSMFITSPCLPSFISSLKYP
ncbi:hypothetical protein MLD38_016228 [Melastoma candidum]|uniref:Uncharacterized protein n=1 Tax=Melastoma candidum TaxID=119954 RepID=A0ACB9RK08_9MYRT|nr:hypothetical protein MLD38_016228 [Melastoma candidum]